MRYELDYKRWGRMFPVPCSVVDDYLKLAPADFVKVLLCLLALPKPQTTTADICAVCGVPAQTADDAVLYWTSLGIFQTIATAGADSAEGAEKNEVPVQKQPVRILSDEREEEPAAATAVPVTNPATAEDPARNSLQKHSHVKLSPKEIEEIATRTPQLRELFLAVQEILKRPINYTEESGLLNLYEYYGFSVPSLLLLVEYCEKIGKARMGYIETIAKSWFELGITEFSAVEKEIIRLLELHSYEKKIAKALRLETALTKKQREYFAQWQDWGFSEEMVLLAYEKCADRTNKLSLPYMNRILESWHTAGISTPEQAENEQPPQKKTAGAKGAKQEKQHSYDLDEFSEFAMNYMPEVQRKKDS